MFRLFFPDDLKEKLDHRLEIFRGKIKFIRNKQREGLIRSRLIGAARASGMSLSFIQDLTCVPEPSLPEQDLVGPCKSALA